MRTPLGVGIVGLDRDGLELASAFEQTHGVELRWLCDGSENRRAAARRAHPSVGVTDVVEHLLADDALDALVVAAAPPSRVRVAARAVAAGKHVFMQGVAACDSAEAWQLVADAERAERVLAVADRSRFDFGLRRLKQELTAGRLGEVLHVTAQRGCFERGSGEPLLSGVGAAEIAVVLDLLGDQPIEVSAHAESHVDEGVDDIVFCSLRFATGVVAHVHASSLDPVGVRRLTVVASDAVAVLEAGAQRPLTLHDVSFARNTGGIGGFATRQLGDVVSPFVPAEDPLLVQCNEFVTSVRTGAGRESSPYQWAVVVDVLEALQRSLARRGAVEPFVAAPPLRPHEAPVIPLAAFGDR